MASRLPSDFGALFTISPAELTGIWYNSSLIPVHPRPPSDGEEWSRLFNPSSSAKIVAAFSVHGFCAVGLVMRSIPAHGYQNYPW